MYFLSLILDETKRCQIGCSILSTVPLYSEMNNRNVYKMSGIKLSLLSFQYTNWLPTYCNDTTGLTINIGCGGKFISNRGIRESCVSDTQCENGTTNSMCNETSEVCECKKGYLFLWESNTCSPIKRETEQTKSSQTGTVMGVGVAGLVLGVVVCGILYFILIHYRKKYQTRRNKEIREEAFARVSCSYRQGNDDMEGLGVYNYIHCEPVNSHVQSDYDHVPQHGVGDDYSHMNSCNANQVFSSGEYGVIS